MRCLQTLTLKLVSLAMLVAGILFTMHCAGMQGPAEWYATAIAQLPENSIVQALLSLILFAVGLWGIIPLPGRKKNRKTAVVAGDYGPITYELEHIESTLIQELKTRPEVERINICITPIENNSRVNIEASGVLRAGRGENARALSSAIESTIAAEMSAILGPDAVGEIRFIARGIILDKRRKPVIAAAPVAKLDSEI